MNKRTVKAMFQVLDKFENTDKRFLKVKIWLMHLGRNENGSYFSKNIVEDNIHTLGNTPILAFIDVDENDKKDFKGHELELVEDGDYYRTKYVGQGVGLIPEYSYWDWEKRVADDGIEREYLVVEGLLWTKLEDSIDILLKRGEVKQSMELTEDYEGYFDENGDFHFTKFTFDGACLLGKEYQEAMTGAKVEIMYSNIDSKKQEVNRIYEEVSSLFELKGETSMTKKINKIAKDFTEGQDDGEVEVEEVVEEVVETPETLDNVEGSDSSEDNPEGSVTLVEPEEPTELTEPEDPETPTEPETPEEEEKEEEIIDDSEELKSKLEKKKKKIEDFTLKIESLENELKELKSFQTETHKKELFESFSTRLEKEKIEEVISNLETFDKETAEKELLVLVGKLALENNAVETEDNKKVEPIKYTINGFQETTNKNGNKNSYGGLW